MIHNYLFVTRTQGISAVLQNFIIKLFGHIFYLYQVSAAFCDLNIALHHIVVSIILRFFFVQH